MDKGPLIMTKSPICFSRSWPWLTKLRLQPIFPLCGLQGMGSKHEPETLCAAMFPIHLENVPCACTERTGDSPLRRSSMCCTHFESGPPFWGGYHRAVFCTILLSPLAVDLRPSWKYYYVWIRNFPKTSPIHGREAWVEVILGSLCPINWTPEQGRKHIPNRCETVALSVAK